MVQCCTAWSLKDSTSVQLKLALICLDGNRDRLVGDCLQS